GPQVEAVGDVVGVFQDLGLRRIALAPAPFLLQLVRERIGILHALDVAARAGIAVPVPGASDARTLLEDTGRKAKPAQPMQHVHAGKARADHDDIIASGSLAVARSWLRRGHEQNSLEISVVAHEHSPRGAESARGKRAAFAPGIFCLAECPVRPSW